MSRLTSLLIFLSFFGINLSTCKAQYWQQQADYKISVALDDENHKLNGEETLVYHNYSPESLSELYFHFWPNGYSDKASPLFRQFAQDGELKAYFAKPDEMGYMKGLDFKIDGENATIEYVDEFHEIGKIALTQPLLPGDSVIITTPFEVKIPGDLSRGGHIGQQYNITQWFPKVALYDSEGWHTMPYLNWGEYYDEFGAYDVSITVPENYVVGATGNLQTAKEHEWLQERIQKSNAAINNEDYSFIDTESSTKTKTVRFTEKNIHDFAWFASKEFLVQMEEFELSSGSHTVEAWAFFDSKAGNKWKKATEYLKNSTVFYSERLGDYPYRTVKAVLGGLKAGGGMEYPTITVISPGTDAVTDRVILHEVGHNWFQGMLGTNERRYPYMDEAINSFYENQYFDRKAESGTAGTLSSVQGSLSDFVIRHNAHKLEDQANNLHSCSYSKINYGMVVYTKAARAFNYLEDYLGEDLFDQCMQTYFANWHFKHPQPADWKKTFEDVAKQDLSWFFDNLMSSPYSADYQVNKVKENTVSIKNRGKLAIPYKVSFKQTGSVVLEKWFDGHVGSKELNDLNISFDEIFINEGVYPYEVNVRNNRWVNGKRSGGRKLQFANPLNTDKNSSFSLFPALGGNTSDGFMLGVAMYNGFIPQPKLEVQLAPMYGFNSGQVVGTGRIRYNHFWRNSFHNSLKFGVRGSRFSRELRRNDGQFDQFINQRIEPFISWKLKRLPVRNSKSHEFSLSFILRELPIYGFSDNGIVSHTFNTLNVQHRFEDTYPAFKQRITTQLQAGSDFSRANVEWKGSIPYSPKRVVMFRLFAGYMLSTNNASPIGPLLNYRLSGNYGQFDPLMEGYLLDRTSTNNVWERQILESGGGFTTQNSVFSSDSYIASLGVSSPLPIIIPPFIRFYTNLGIVPNNSTLSVLRDAVQLTWEGGFSVSIYKDVCEIYFPLLYSSDMRDYLEVNKRGPFQETSFNFLNNVTFRFDLQKLNPFDAGNQVHLLGG